MNPRLRLALRWLLTVVLVTVAFAAALSLWRYYNRAPWTRDGRVRSDAVQIAPDVSGLITRVAVRDDEVVKAGQVLFVIDTQRFTLAERQAEASVHAIDVQIAQAQRENRRNIHLDDLASNESREQSKAKVDQLNAMRLEALAALDVARLNLERATVRAPVNGIVTNIEMQPGDYATAGHAEFALLATDSLRVEGYFEETRIHGVHIGDMADITLMGDEHVITGRVESIAGGVEDRDRASSPRLLASVNPTFNWVRLAQRIPVRIRVEKVPPGTLLIAGRTVTVRIRPHGAAP